MTEFGTAMVMLHYSPELVERSVESLAAPKSEKRLRKRLMLDGIRCRASGASPDFDGYEYPARKLTYGTSFSLDFLALVFTRMYGPEIVSRWMDGLEAIDIDALNTIDIEWIYKYNPLFAETVPPEWRCTMKSKMEAAGISEFSDGDWLGYRALRKMLSMNYKFPQD